MGGGRRAPGGGVCGSMAPAGVVAAAGAMSAATTRRPSGRGEGWIRRCVRLGKDRGFRGAWRRGDCSGRVARERGARVVRVSIALPPALRELVARLPAGTEAYLVGGAVRDLLLGRPLVDLDLAVPRGAVALARRLAHGLGVAFVPLD